MLLIPAIDIKNGECVRLRQGRMDDVTVFGADPVEMAKKWLDAGAQRLHVVDLDGATKGEPVNLDAISAICDAAGEIPVQVGGGIREEDHVEQLLDAGVRYTIIGTRAVTAPHLIGDLCCEFPGHIMVGLDAKDGKVATEGWSKLSHHDVVDLAQHFESDGVMAIIFTDIAKDGMMQGVNAAATRELAQNVAIPVILSGGVSRMEDIDTLMSLEEDGVTGAIIGRALYEGALDLAECHKRIKGDAG